MVPSIERAGNIYRCRIVEKRDGYDDGRYGARVCINNFEIIPQVSVVQQAMRYWNEFGIFNKCDYSYYQGYLYISRFLNTIVRVLSSLIIEGRKNY